MNKKLLALWIFMVLSSPALVFGSVGEIAYIEGTVEITRDGEIMDDMDLDIGSEIENYDQIRTGSDGNLVISIQIGPNRESEIHVADSTTFVVEVNAIGGKERTTFGLITGSLGLKVQKLTGNRQMEVRTETVAMGVRGTEFSVQTSPTSDILVTCSEGRVSCYDEDDGSEYYAEPGQAVEKRVGEYFRSIPIAVSRLENFRQEWITERIEAFKSNALRAMRFYVSKYDELYDRFNAEYNALMLKNAILNKWFQEEREGRVGSTLELMREKREIIGHLFRIRGILFLFERVYYRLLEMHGYFKEGYGRGEVKPGLSTEMFFSRFLEERRDLAQKAARIRFIIKLYAKRNEGSFPLSKF